jgi:DNA-binding response OmpR family regulator
MVIQNSTTTGIDLDQIVLEGRRSILIVEDEPDTTTLLKQILLMAGHNVMSASGGQEALRKVMEHIPDLVLLDLMMPEMDGWQFYRYLKQIAEIPVIIISALSEKSEVVRGLHVGADDYIGKPFHNAEVVERVNAVLRRSRKTQDETRLVFPKTGLVIDTSNQEVSVHGQPIELTPKEYAILSILAHNAPSIVKYETIAHSIWNYDSPEIRNRTKYLVYLLRRKLDKAIPGRNLILNLDRRGYKLQTDSM